MDCILNSKKNKYLQIHICIYNTCNKYVQKYLKTLNNSIQFINSNKNFKNYLKSLNITNPDYTIKPKNDIEKFNEELQIYKQNIDNYKINTKIIIPNDITKFFKTVSNTNEIASDKILELFDINNVIKSLFPKNISEIILKNIDKSIIDIEIDKKNYDQFLVQVYYETFCILTSILVNKALFGSILIKHEKFLNNEELITKNKNNLIKIFKILNGIKEFYLNNLDIEIDSNYAEYILKFNELSKHFKDNSQLKIIDFSYDNYKLLLDKYYSNQNHKDINIDTIYDYLNYDQNKSVSIFINDNIDIIKKIEEIILLKKLD